MDVHCRSLQPLQGDSRSVCPGLRCPGREGMRSALRLVLCEAATAATPQHSVVKTLPAQRELWSWPGPGSCGDVWGCAGTPAPRVSFLRGVSAAPEPPPRLRFLQKPSGDLDTHVGQQRCSVVETEKVSFILSMPFYVKSAGKSKADSLAVPGQVGLVVRGLRVVGTRPADPAGSSLCSSALGTPPVWSHKGTSCPDRACPCSGDMPWCAGDRCSSAFQAGQRSSGSEVQAGSRWSGKQASSSGVLKQAHC